jgi:glucose/mannose-6-phosphate isomerase
VTDVGGGFLDTLSMWDAVAAQPERVAAALATPCEPWDLGAGVNSVHLVGVGASGTVCDAAAAFLRAQGHVPVTCGRGPEVPSFVGPHTLVVAVGAAGEGEESLEAVGAARQRGAPILAVIGETDGGSLGALADSAGLARLVVPGGGGPLGRAGVASALAALLAALAPLELAPTAGPSLHAAAAALPRRRDVLLSPGGPADELARRIGRTIPLVYGAAGWPGVAARHWKAQCNENAKTPAFCAVLPDVAYDEVSGWGQHGDVTRQVLTLVALRHGGEHPLVARRFAAVLEATDEVMAGVETVWAEGEDDLARFLDLCLFGDACMLFLAGREGIDPGPVAAAP